MSEPPPAFLEQIEAQEAQWRRAVEQAIGASLETLASATQDGFSIGPLHAPTRGPARALAGKTRGFAPLARIDETSLHAAGQAARLDVASGAAGLDLVSAGSSCAFGLGLPDLSTAQAVALLECASLPADSLVQIAPPAAPASEGRRFAGVWVEACGRVGAAPPRLSFDPGALSAAEIQMLMREAGEGARRLFAADGRRAHAAGASEGQEVGLVLSAAVATLRAGAHVGVSPAQMREKLFFRLAADTDFLLCVAKFRALRLAWRRVERALELTPEPIEIHADSAWRMMTRLDPWTNVLRVGSAVAAAAIGGADAIVALPFTRALGAPNDDARRLALTTQLALLHEADLGNVADSAGGAGVFEAASDEIATRAWSFFQMIEECGGAQSEQGRARAAHEIARVRTARFDALARGADHIVGVTLHPLEREVDAQVIAPLPDRDEPLWLDLPAVRLAQELERGRGAVS